LDAVRCKRVEDPGEILFTCGNGNAAQLAGHLESNSLPLFIGQEHGFASALLEMTDGLVWQTARVSGLFASPSPPYQRIFAPLGYPLGDLALSVTV